MQEISSIVDAHLGWNQTLIIYKGEKMKKKFLNVDIDFKSIDEEKGEFEAYLSVFGNPDRGGDIVAPGAFKNSLSKRGNKLYPLLYQHNHNDVIGGFSAVEDAHGLKMFGQFNLDTQKGKEAYSNAKKGYLTGFSMGYTVDEYERDNKNDVTILKEVTLWEGSIVTFPMNEEAQLTSIKSLPENEREFERFLRDAGYSRTKAKAITCHGFNYSDDQREAEQTEKTSQEKALSQSIETLLENMKELKKCY